MRSRTGEERRRGERGGEANIIATRIITAVPSSSYLHVFLPCHYPPCWLWTATIPKGLRGFGKNGRPPMSHSGI